MNMQFLILLLISHAILAQRYPPKGNDQNDEPFMPIFPVYPYNPKLMKRGADRELITQLTPELYTPKVDARETYASSLSASYPRDPYIPNYNPYPKTQSPSSSYSTYYSASPYTTYSTTPYNIHNSYSTPTYTSTLPSSAYSSAPYSNNAYTGIPYSSTTPFSSTSYPNYYYQPPYYYPPYYNSPFPPPPPPPNQEYSKDTLNDAKEEKEKSNSKAKKNNDDNDSNQNAALNQFIDGGNYISLSTGNLKDLDSQSSTYKLASPYNQLEQLAKRIKTLAIPLQKGNYKIINMSGQPDYSTLPATVVKAQELEQLLAQTVAKLLAQNTAQITQMNPNYEGNRNILIAKTNDEAYTHPGVYKDHTQPRFVSMPNVLAKTGLAYVIDPNTLNKINLAQINGGPILQTQKNTRYIQKPITRVTLEESPGIYIPPNKSGKQQTLPIQSAEYDAPYENTPMKSTQNYENYTADQSGNKQDENYDNNPGQPAGTFKGQNYVTVQTPQSYNYRYGDYQPSQTSPNQQQQQQSQKYKTSLEDVNFGAKTSSEE